MKFLILIILGSTMIQCQSEASHEISRFNSPSNLAEKQKNNLEFPEYKLEPKDTLFETKEFGIQSQTIELGIYLTDSTSYKVVREFRLIPGVEEDSPRGRSTLYLINGAEDTLMFDAGMPEELPIDIYKNQFVFIGENGKFVFESIQDIHIEEHMLCYTGRGCFM